MKTMTPTIRLAEARDRPELDRFANEVVPEVYEPLVDSEYANRLIEDWWLDSLDPSIESGRLLVAIDEDRVVGVAEVDQVGDDPVLWKLYVEAGARNRGLGARMLREVVDRLPRGTQRLVLEHIAANADAARFYEQNEFEVIRVDQEADSRISLVWRALALEPAEDTWAAHVEMMRTDAIVESSVLLEIAEWLTAVRKPRHVVDVGCGIGSMASLLAVETGAAITAVDESEAMLEETMWTARAQGVATQVDTMRLDLSKPFDESTIPDADLVWASASIHHLGDEVVALERLRSLLRPHGHLALSEGGLSTRMLPFDLGVGEPGLETRIQAAFDTKFLAMRHGLDGAVEPGVGWPSKLEKAGYSSIASKSFLLDIPSPLSGDLRQVVVSRLEHAAMHLRDQLSGDDIAVLSELTDRESPNYVARRDDIYFLGARTVYLASTT